MASAPATCVGWSAVTAVGPSIRHSGFYLRAGRSNFVTSSFVDSLGEAVVLSCVSTLPKDMTGPARVAALASGALEAALSPLQSSLGAAKARLCLALPARYRGQSKKAGLSAEANELLTGLQAQERFGVDANVATFPEGVAAGALAFAHALKLIETYPSDVAIVCGVDSYYDESVLAQLEREDRLMTADNVDALRPGEAAACLVLAGAKHPLTRARGAAQLLAVGVGEEPTAQNVEQHTMARGLSEALRTAASPLRAAGLRCNWVWTALTHEERHVRELQILLARFGDIMGFEMRLETPARELGEVGAATLPLFAALAVEAWHRRYASDTHALCFASSHHGLCGALCLKQAAT